MMEEKAALRRRLLLDRAALDPALRERWSRAIAAHLCAMPAFQSARTVLTFLGTPQEVDTSFIVAAAFAAGKEVGVPVCLDGRTMRFYRIEPQTPLKPGRYGILEPDAARCEPAAAGEGSVCITPALCYDREGYRVGYGAGYYDRFFAAYGGVRIGVCYGRYAQLDFFHDETDRAVQYLVTEQGATPTACRFGCER